MLENLKSPGRQGSDVRANTVPESWRARAEYDEAGGFVVSPARVGELPGADEALKEHGLDPSEWRVVSVRRGRWQRYDGEWLESLRVNVVPAGLEASPGFDLEQLVDEVRRWRPGKSQRVVTGSGAYVHVGADKQIGKKAEGHGTEQTVRRILEGTDASVDRLARLRKYGLSLGTVVLPEVGDHVEGNVSQNGRLQGQAASDLGQTEQVRVARRLLLAQVKAFAPLAERVIVPVVNGNHDEVTRQVIADPSDGWNVETASAVAMACEENPALAHVEFRFPATGHQTLTVDVEGTLLGLFHGHQFSRDIEKFLSGQMLGQTELGGADVWLSGHFHNFRSQDIGSRFWMQAPTVDPGSSWYRDRSGMNSKPGVLTYVMGGGYDPREHIGVIEVK